ncbi:MAG: MFS transporter [Bdellovibrionaceae bacterium]|nr:MFS transporter [Pseudobdellovibrionaceae bacterium]
MIAMEASAPVERSLKLSLADAFLYSLMVGIGETYLPAFALSVGLGEIFAGVLSSLPMVSGAFLQLLTPKGLQKVGSHKYWVVLSVSMQALAFVPLIYYSVSGHPEFWVLFLILTLYWGAGFAANPSWNYWMAHLVPREMGQKYFSTRTSLTQIGILIGLVIGGVALHNKVTILSFTSVFSGLFLIAFLCRAGSSLFLSRKLFRADWRVDKKNLSGVRDSWRVFWMDPVKRRFFLRLVPFMACVYVSAPFVTPYFLAQLKLDYGAYMVAIAALMLGKIAALAVLNRRPERGGGLGLFILGVVAVSPLPILWSVSTNGLFILGLQFVSGAALASMELGLSLIFFRDLKAEEKVAVLTVYNLLNALSIILGTAIGGVLLGLLGESVRGYLVLFAFGGIARVVFSRPLVRQARRWQNENEKSDAVLYPASGPQAR